MKYLTFLQIFDKENGYSKEPDQDLKFRSGSGFRELINYRSAGSGAGFGSLTLTASQGDLFTFWPVPGPSRGGRGRGSALGMT
jgi:hypothetical protein